MTQEHPEGELVPLVEIDGVQVSSTRPAPAARVPSACRQWWRAPSRLELLALAMVVVALGSLVAVGGARHRRHVEVRAVVAARLSAGDALGCPVDVTCAVRPAQSVQGILADYGFAASTETELYDVAAPTLVYSRLLVGTRGPNRLTLWSRCPWVSWAAASLGVPAFTSAVAVTTTVQRTVRGLEVFLRETNSAVIQFAGRCTMSVRNVQTNPLYLNARARSFAYVVRDLAADLRLQP